MAEAGVVETWRSRIARAAPSLAMLGPVATVFVPCLGIGRGVGGYRPGPVDGAAARARHAPQELESLTLKGAH